MFAEGLAGSTSSNEKISCPSRTKDSPDLALRDLADVLLEKSSRKVVELVRFLAATISVESRNNLDAGVKESSC